MALSLWATIPSGPSAVWTQTRSPAYTQPHETLLSNEKGRQSDQDYSQGCVNCVLELEAGRPGGTVTQNKSDYPGRVCSSFKLAISLIPSFVESFLSSASESTDICFCWLFVLQILSCSILHMLLQPYVATLFFTEDELPGI